MLFFNFQHLIVDLTYKIELLVMRALSLGLVKGSIDQIDSKIFISWVQPRVLDINQVSYLFCWRYTVYF